VEVAKREIDKKLDKIGPIIALRARPSPLP
jgi:hypothetical protein